MKARLLLLSLFVSLVTCVNAAPPAEDGKAIFTARCAACHNINKQLTGPALAGVHERRSMEWIINFVKSSQSMIKKGDKDAVALFEKFNKIPMPDHSDLTEDHIKSIVEFVKAEGKTATETAPFAKPAKLRPNYVPLSASDYGVFLGFLGSLAILIGVLLLLVKVKEYQRNQV